MLEYYHNWYVNFRIELYPEVIMNSIKEQTADITKHLGQEIENQTLSLLSCHTSSLHVPFIASVHKKS